MQLPLLLSKPLKLFVAIYNFFLVLYRLAISISSLWSPKARKWIRGRRNVFEHIRREIGGQPPASIWIHCSSLGEFEQGKPLIEMLRMQHPRYKIVLTFFSPSGYEVKKKYSGVDHVFYLPMDSKKNSARFLDLINPVLIIFVKYDYWYYYLDQIKKRKINCLLISAVFRKNQAFFEWYGGLQRRMLDCFTQIFVQTEESKSLLTSVRIHNCIVSGDTRFDSVVDTVNKFTGLPAIEKFLGEQKCIVAGSTWRDDEEILKKAFEFPGTRELKLIIAPHEVHKTHLDHLQRLFPESCEFSKLESSGPQDFRTLIIDNVGMLSRLYKYAYITYVGGGFTKDGVHNVLEAAAYGRPVVFGPNYKKYREAGELIDSGGAQCFHDAAELANIIARLGKEKNEYEMRSAASGLYVSANKGASRRIMNYIEENRLLTN